jgi:hypothetical protein
VLLAKLADGGVSERPKERASKAREGKPSEGSNPSATATCKRRLFVGGAFAVRGAGAMTLPLAAPPCRLTRGLGGVA